MKQRCQHYLQVQQCTNIRFSLSQVQTVCQEAYRNLHISVRLMADELLGSLFDDLGLCEGPEGCHGD